MLVIYELKRSYGDKINDEVDKDELANQVIDFIEYLKFSHISMEAPDSVVIKSKKDF